MSDFEPGDRVAIKTEFYEATNPDYNSGEGVVVMKGCGVGCECGTYYEVLHDLDARKDLDWRTVSRQFTTPYDKSELTKID